MPSLLIANPGEKLNNLCDDFCHANRYSKRQNATHFLSSTEKLNPSLINNIGPNSSSPLQGFQPILLPDEATAETTAFNCQLSGEDARQLGIIANDIGGANTMALAAMMGKYDLYSKAADLNTFGGGGLGAGTLRASKFLQALDNYDKVVAEYEGYRNHRAAPGTRLQLQAKMKMAFNTLQVEFNRETQALLSQNTAHTQRVIIESPSGPRAASRSIPLKNIDSMKTLAKFAKYGKGLGYGVIAIDGYLRYQMVSELHQTGGNWKREAWAQGAGFTMGLATAAAVGSFIIMFSPVGLVVGILAAGAAALLSDKVATTVSYAIYDFFH